MLVFWLGMFLNAPVSGVKYRLADSSIALNNQVPSRVLQLLKPLGAERWAPPTSSHIVFLNQSGLYPLPTLPPPSLFPTSHQPQSFSLDFTLVYVCLVWRGAEMLRVVWFLHHRLVLCRSLVLRACVLLTASGLLPSHLHSLIIYISSKWFLGCFSMGEGPCSSCVFTLTPGVSSYDHRTSNNNMICSFLSSVFFSTHPQNTACPDQFYLIWSDHLNQAAMSSATTVVLFVSSFIFISGKRRRSFF